MAQRAAKGPDGETLQLFHGSEVAYWSNADMHVSGVLQAVPSLPGTEVIFESTAAGPLGLFYEMCASAMRGEGEYILIFIPWFWQEEYRLPIPDGFTPTNDEIAYRDAYGLDDNQIVWRRDKIVELKGVHNFRREYPATAEEAFSAELPGALWTREQINNLRVPLSAMPEMKRIADVDGGVEVSPDIDASAYAAHEASHKQTRGMLAAIAALGAQQTPRRIREAHFGIDGGWLKNLDAEIAALRAQSAT